MKKIILFSILFTTLRFSCLGAESYSVLNVIGTIKIKSTGAILKKGDVINSEAQIIFATADAKAAVFSASKGRFTLAPGAAASGGSEFLAYVKNALIPNTNTLATRAGGTILNLVDFQNKLCKGKFLVLPGTAVPISPDAFKIDDSHFFFLRMTYNGVDVNKKLVYENGKLILDPSAILSVDTKQVLASETKNYQFFIYNGETKVSEPVGLFDPVFTDPKELKEAASLIVNLMKDNGAANDKIRDEVKSYFVEYFGEPDPDTFSSWMKTEFGL